MINNTHEGYVFPCWLWWWQGIAAYVARLGTIKVFRFCTPLVSPLPHTFATSSVSAAERDWGMKWPGLKQPKDFQREASWRWAFTFKLLQKPRRSGTTWWHHYITPECLECQAVTGKCRFQGYLWRQFCWSQYILIQTVSPGRPKMLTCRFCYFPMNAQWKSVLQVCVTACYASVEMQVSKPMVWLPNAHLSSHRRVTREQSCDRIFEHSMLSLNKEPKGCFSVALTTICFLKTGQSGHAWGQSSAPS